jgi:hypothetical protein
MSAENVDISDVNDFEQLLDMVRLDANLVDQLTDDQVTELRKKLNPYGRTVEGSGKFTCLSITNMSELYMKRFLMTSLIGFLYRQCDEHGLDDGEPPMPLDNFESFMAEYVNATSAAGIAHDEQEKFNEETSGVSEDDLTPEQKAIRLNNRRIIDRASGFKKRLIVRQFLDGLFQFNPDAHVRSAYADNPLDPERVEPAQITRKKNIKTIIGKSGNTIEVDKSNNTTDVADPPLSDEQVIATPSIFEPTEEEAAARASSDLVKHVPPLDTFHRWTYYTDSNYEEIRSATTDLYSEKPDLEFAINPYEQFDSDKKAEEFVMKHKNEVIADIATLHNSNWNLLGSFKKNRERINFYNEKTAVIEEIFKQMEQDKKLGADMMRKRVRRKKKKNTEESGPEPEEFKSYRKDNPSGFSNMGAEDVIQENNKSTKEDDVTFKVHDECPYDGIQVDVFDFRRGGQHVKKSEFFTEAEEPKELGGV